MAWSAAHPSGGWDARAGAWVQARWDEARDWRRADPLDAAQNWSALALAVHDGDPARGARLIALNGCGACHTIPGIAGARGSVGPTLEDFADRAYVAGVLPNRPGGLVRWLMNPPAHAPDTAMPDLGLSERQARDIAAYLYRPRGG